MFYEIVFYFGLIQLMHLKKNMIILGRSLFRSVNKIQLTYKLVCEANLFSTNIVNTKYVFYIII